MQYSLTTLLLLRCAFCDTRSYEEREDQWEKSCFFTTNLFWKPYKTEHYVFFTANSFSNLSRPNFTFNINNCCSVYWMYLKLLNRVIISGSKILVVVRHRLDISKIFSLFVDPLIHKRQSIMSTKNSQIIKTLKKYPSAVSYDFMRQGPI